MKTKQTVAIILSIVMGLLFLFSAWSKTKPNTGYFEYIISSQLHISSALSAIIARIVIGLEAALGTLLLINIFGHKKWVIKVSILLLIAFTIHLSILWITQGNDVDCGCMGSVVPMSPALSVLKNVAMLIILVLIHRWQQQKDGAVLNIATIPVAIFIMIVPFFYVPLRPAASLDLNKLYHTDDASASPSIDLRKGKHLFGVLSMGCPHCRDAAKILGEYKRNNNNLPIYFAIVHNNDSTKFEQYADFVKETQSDNIPHYFIDKNDFEYVMKATNSSGIPILMWLQDSVIVRRLNNHELNQKELEHWIK
jgi:thiol-disulfide isomerase/thioredoxin